MLTPEWKADIDNRLRHIEMRGLDLTNRVDSLEKRGMKAEAALLHNTQVTEEINVKVGQIADALGALILVIEKSRVAARCITWCIAMLSKAVNKVARWLLPIATLVGVLWGLIEAIRRSK